MVSSRKFLPRGGIGRKFQERCGAPTKDSNEIKRCETRSSFISEMVQGSFIRRGGVGRKCQEGSKGKHIHILQCWSRCWCPLLSLCHHLCTYTRTLPNIKCARTWSVQESFFRHWGVGRKCMAGSKLEHIHSVSVIKRDSPRCDSIMRG